MRIQIARGQTLLEALQQAKIEVHAPCGGNGTCGLCTVEVYGYGRVKSCQFCKPGIYEIKLPEKEAFRVLREEGERAYPWYQKRVTEGTPFSHEQAQFVAVDLGTTTVAVTAYLHTGVSEASFVNPQRAYGADVIHRIQAANAGKQQELHQLIVNRLEEILRERKVPKEVPVYISGNTTMQHLFENLSVKGLGNYPFTPVDLSYRRVHAIGEDGRAFFLLPGISAYVGGDIVSGIYGLDIYKAKAPVLLLDFGTNGEMVLGTEGQMYVTSTSAGPAFEGSALGMELHGAGILKLLALLRKQGILDETGLLQEPYFSEGYPVSLWKKDCDLVLTQDFIREVQMAKAAMTAGIEVLLQHAGVKPEEVEKIYLAGGMGHLMDPSDAVVVGLLPKEMKGRCIPVGNASLMGAIRLGENRGTFPQAACTNAKEIVLSNEETFESRYLSHMSFPKLGNL